MDGLLLDTEGIYTEVTSTIAARYGRTFDWSVKQNIIGRGAGDLARYVVRGAGPADHRRRVPGDSRAADARAFSCSAGDAGCSRSWFGTLKANNIPIAVGTSSSSQSFGQKTTLHRDWFALFDFIVTADDPEVGAAKPAPDIFLTAARRLGVAPEDCLVFEDSPFGVTAAKAAGMTAIAIPDAAMADEKYAHADGILRTLKAFKPSACGLPALEWA